MTVRLSSKATRLVFLSAALFTTVHVASAATCDRACLLAEAKQFNSEMLAHTPGKLALAADVKIRENTKAIALPESRWFGVKQVLSEGVYADPVKGNVIAHAAAQTISGKAVYIGTRLKIADGRIAEIEINFDDSDRVNLKNLVPYDPVFNTLVPTEERVTRAQLESIITSYFKGLTDHQPVQADYARAATGTTAAIASPTTPGTE